MNAMEPAEFVPLGTSVALLSAQNAAEGWLRSVSTEPQRTCPSCGNEFSGAMEFCPGCVLHHGLDAEHVDGNSPDRREILERYANNETRVLSSAILLTEEFDQPDIDQICVICAPLRAAVCGPK